MPTTGVLSIGEDANITITPVGKPEPEKQPETEKAPNEKELTPEELTEMSDAMIEGLFGQPKPKKTEKAAPAPTEAEKQKADADAKAAADAEQKKKDDEAEAAKAKKASKPAAKPAPPTADEIADKVAAKLQPEVKTDPDKKNEEPKLSAEDQQKREVLAEMAKANPKEYSNHVNLFDKFIAVETAYREKWEKSHPDGEFEPEDDEHKEFYEKHQPTFVEDDYDNARIRVEARKIAREENAQKEQREIFEKARDSVLEKLKTVEPEIIKDLAIATDPELAKLKDIQEEDVLAAAAMAPHVRELAEQVEELIKAFEPRINYRFNAETNPIHAKLAAATFGFENELMALPEKDRRADDGRTLVKYEDYHRMTPAQRKNHWSIWAEPMAIRALLIRDAAAKSKRVLDKLRGHTGKSANASADTTPPKPKDEATAKPAPAADKKAFPNTAGGADGVVSGGAMPAGDTSFSKAIGDALFGS